MPPRSGTTTVWSFASSAAIGDHMSPVSPKPWISTTAGPWPPTRTLIAASAFTTCKLRKSAGKGVGAACADRAPSARLAARPAATRRKRLENVDETVADMLGSFGWGDVHPGFENVRYSRMDKSHVAIRAVSAPLHDGMNACGGNGNFASDVIWVGQSAVCAYAFRHCLVLTITFAQYHPQRFSYLYARTIRSHNGGLGAL